MIGGIHHAGLTVTDLAEASARWQRLLGLSPATAPPGAPAPPPAAAAGGFETREASASLHSPLLRCAYEDFCVRLSEGDRGCVGYIAYELEPGVTLAQAGDRLSDAGTLAVPIELPSGRFGLRSADPDGNGVVVVEHVAPDDPRPDVCKQSDTLPGFHPRRLQHVNYLTGDTPRAVRWYVEALGLKITDWIGDDACWLHADRDHHVLAFLDKGYAHIHHVAFELTDWGEMRVGLDHLAAHRRPIVWGPGRHGMAQNLFAYWRMPEEDTFIEFFADMEVLGPNHQVRHFPDDAFASNTWGQLPPRSYFRFDEEAIRAEWDQSQQLGAPLS